jgi:hypothetical protein
MSSEAPMRIQTPCSQDLDSMPRAESGGGVHCTACDRDVVDLRKTPKKRALAVIDTLRRTGDGKVCVRVRATRDGVPVFQKDPSPFARFALPAVFAGSLAACAPSAGADRETTPIAMIPTEQQPVTNPNVNGTATVVVVTPVSHVTGGSTQPGAIPDHVEMAGGLAWGGP